MAKETEIGGIKADNIVGFPNMPGHNHDDVEVNHFTFWPSLTLQWGCA